MCVVILRTPDQCHRGHTRRADTLSQSLSSETCKMGTKAAILSSEANGSERDAKTPASIARMRICSAAHWASTYCLALLHHRRCGPIWNCDRRLPRNLELLTAACARIWNSATCNAPHMQRIRHPWTSSVDCDSSHWPRGGFADRTLAFGGVNACLSAIGVELEAAVTRIDAFSTSLDNHSCRPALPDRGLERCGEADWRYCGVYQRGIMNDSGVASAQRRVSCMSFLLKNTIPSSPIPSSQLGPRLVSM